MNTLRGHLLIASPHLPDPNFYRSVVLMVQHDNEGAFGLILNRPSDVSVGQVWEKVANVPCENLSPVNVGGPVGGPLMAVHTVSAFSEAQILPGVYFATQREYLDRIVQQQHRPALIFSGYAGWGGGQLDGELAAGGWLTTPASVDYLFHPPADLWKAVTADIGSGILARVSPKKNLPADPTLN